MTSFKPMRATDEEGLAIIGAEIHDAYFDLDQLVLDGDAASVPLSRVDVRKRLIGWTSRLGENPTWDAQLVVRRVVEVLVEDDQGIGTYSINQLALDIDAGTIRLDLNEAASVVFATGGGVDVEVQALTQ
jgi:hypothetical protein